MYRKRADSVRPYYGNGYLRIAFLSGNKEIYLENPNDLKTIDEIPGVDSKLGGYIPNN